MVDNTPRFGLNDYQPGDENWDHSDLVTKVDELGIQRDVASNRPESGEYEDELFYATDQATLYRWDDESGAWNAVAGLGTESNPVGGTAYREAINAERASSKSRINPNGRGNRPKPSVDNRHHLISQTGCYRKPVVHLMFDDAWKDNFENRAVFEENGIKVGLAVPTENVGNSVRMSWDEVSTWSEEGHAIYSHGTGGSPWSERTIDEIVEDVVTSTETLLDHGFDSNHFIYGGGYPGDAAARGILDELFSWGWRSQNDEVIHDVWPQNHMQMPRSSMDGRPMSEIEALIDEAVANQTGLVLNGHHLIDGAIADEGDLDTSTEKINQIVSYVESSDAELVGSLDDVIRHSPVPISFSHGSGGIFHNGTRTGLQAPEDGYWKLWDSDGNAVFEYRDETDAVYQTMPSWVVEVTGYSPWDLSEEPVILQNGGFVNESADLSGVDGRYGDETRVDDGTNTPNGNLGVAIWEESASEWQGVELGTGEGFTA